MGKILFIDSETSGLPNDNWPNYDENYWPRLVQLAYAIYDEDGTKKESRGFLIKPYGFEISASATKIHGITNEFALNNGLELSQVLREFSEKPEDSKILAGHNINFDLNVVQFEYIRRKEQLNLPKKVICTMRHPRIINYCQLPSRSGYGYKWPRLCELHKILFDCDFEGAHDALSDVLATAKCYFKLKEMGFFEEKTLPHPVGFY